MTDAKNPALGGDAHDRLLDAAPEATPDACTVPATLGALLDLHGMDPALDSRRYTASGRAKVVAARRLGTIRSCHAGFAGLMTAATALALGAGAAQFAAAVLVGAIAALTIARSHRSAPGAQPQREILVGFAAAALVTAIVVLQPALGGSVPGFCLVPGAALAAIVGICAATLGVFATISRRPLLARASIMVARSSSSSQPSWTTPRLGAGPVSRNPGSSA
jgi:hypothetical protein